MFEACLKYSLTLKIIHLCNLKRGFNDGDSKVEFKFGRVENIAGKGENAGYQDFLLFPRCFQTERIRTEQ